MARNDLTTYEIWLSEDGVAQRPTLLYSFQDEVGLSDSAVYTAAVARLQDIIDKINDPSPDTRFVKIGVIYPPGVSVRRQRYQDSNSE